MGKRKGPEGSAPMVDVSVAEERAKSWPGANPGMRPVSELKAFDRNSRTHTPAQIDQVAASIREWGFTSPVLIRGEDDTILAGHARVLAAERLGIAEVPVIVAWGWSQDQARAYVIADNKLALNAGWDEAILASELALLDANGFAIDLLGFSDAELADLDPEKGKGLTDPDAVPEPGPSPVSVLGDVWILGPHRVTCGDSTSIADVERVMGGVLADACWTDPPYNVNYEGSAGKIANDHMEGEAFAAFLLDAFVAGFAAMKPGASIYVAHADTEGLSFRAAFKSAGFKLSGCLVWAKQSLVLGRSPYQWQHEPILFGWKPGSAHRWFGGRKQTTVLSLDGDGVFGVNNDGSVTVRVGQRSLIIRGTDMQVEPVEPTVIYCDKPKASADHPTMKPVALIEKMLGNSSRKGDLVLDLFGGSGSTLIACETLGRHARLVELDGKFVDVIVKRWQDFTGLEAVLEADGRTFASVSAEHFGGGRK